MGISVLSQESRTVCTARKGIDTVLGQKRVGIHRRWGSRCQTLSSDSFPEIPAEREQGDPIIIETCPEPSISYSMSLSVLFCLPSPSQLSYSLFLPLWPSSSSSESKTRSPMVMSELYRDGGHTVGRKAESRYSPQ